MDIYTIGRELVLPVVVLLLSVSALLTLLASIFTAVKILTSAQHLLQRMDQSGRPSVTVNIHNGMQSPKPPMQEQE
jgi:hypothetical protein